MDGRISTYRDLLSRGNDGDLTLQDIFDKIFSDVDARVTALEGVSNSVAALQKSLTDYGQALIDQTVDPLVQQLLSSVDLGTVFTAHSVSEIDLGASTATFTIFDEERIKFAPAAMIVAVDEDNPERVMYGRKTAYDRSSGQLTIEVLSANGTGPASSWVITAGTLASMASLVTINPTGAIAANNLQLCLQQLSYALGDNPDFAIDVAEALADRYVSSEVDALLSAKATTADIATAIAALSLKSASQKVAQTDVNDATAGALMQVGAFGLGLNALGTTLQIADFDTANVSGLYKGAGTGTSNGPSSNFAGMVLVMAHNTNRCAQIAVSPAGALYVRAKNAGTWGAWAQATLV